MPKTIPTLRILLVEDHSPWQGILQNLLNQALSDINLQGVIKAVETGAEAREAIDSDSPWHLLIVDLSLPDEPEDKEFEHKETGYQLIHHARQEKIPTIVVTGKATVSDAVSIIKEEKVIDFFEKRGFTDRRRAFLEHVKQVLQEAALRSNPQPVRSLENAHALIIGIANYNHLPSLSKTTVDAQDFYDTLLQSGYTESNVSVLVDQQATKNAIDTRLSWLANRVKADDMVVIFFSGHGAQLVGGFSPGEYLCPIEAEPSKLKETCISHYEFTTALTAIPARRLIVLLDACHSGGIGELKSLDGQIKAGLSETAYARLSEGEGRVILASCRPNEFSWELSDMRNGLFTHYLLEGIRGEAANTDGMVRISKLFNYIYQHVSQHNPNCQQHPFMKFLAEDFIIAITAPSS